MQHGEDVFSRSGLGDELNEINEELTAKARQDPRYTNFVKWLLDNGARFPRVDFPVAFGKGGLIGAAALQDIKHWEAFLFIPAKLIISETSVRADPILGPVVNTHEQIFKDHYDGQYMTLIVFIMSELVKGKDSFWHPYFEATNPSDLLSFWDMKELRELQDEQLFYHAIAYRKQVEDEWALLQKIFLIYPQIFPLDKFTKEQFVKAYKMVVSRCFGWSLPCTMMIPFADCLNHFTTDTQYEVYHKNLHQTHASISSQGYSTKNKYKVDYADLYGSAEEWELVLKENKQLCLAGGPRRKQRPTLKTLKEKFDNQIPKSEKLQIWELGAQNTTDQEDNDTSDEQEEEEDEEDEEANAEEEVKRKERLLQKELAKSQSSLKTTEQEQKLRYDLIDKLIEKKASEIEKAEIGKLEEQDDDEEEDAEEEDFAWWKHNDPDMYFSMTTKSKSYFAKGNQVFNCYGRRTNRFLLLNYGFTLQHNKYNSVAFKVNIDLNPKNEPAQIADVLKQGKSDKQETKKDKQGLPVGPDPAVQYTKQIRLKRDYMSQCKQEQCLELFAYLRANLFNKYEGKNIQKIMISTPVCIDYEILMLTCAIQLLKALYKARFKTHLTEDLVLLKDPATELADRQLLAVRSQFNSQIWYRVASKEIVNQNLLLCQITLQILQRIHNGAGFREAYIMRVPEYEDQEEVCRNRILIRRYLRELAQNRQKLFNISLN